MDATPSSTAPCCSARQHLANLYACITGDRWTNFNDGWLGRYWSAIGNNYARALINDPFFTATIGNPTTPNGVPIPSNGLKPSWVFEPTSIAPPVDSNVCQYPECGGDPKVPGRLDEITFLLERCHRGSTWPWRTAATGPTIDEAAVDGVEMPRLTL